MNAPSRNVGGTMMCPVCDRVFRLVGRRRFCRRVGPGGPCPHREEPVAVADLLAITPEGR